MQLKEYQPVNSNSVPQDKATIIRLHLQSTRCHGPSEHMNTVARRGCITVTTYLGCKEIVPYLSRVRLDILRSCLLAYLVVVFT
jgi:hypothetical protein